MSSENNAMEQEDRFLKELDARVSNLEEPEEVKDIPQDVLPTKELDELKEKLMALSEDERMKFFANLSRMKNLNPTNKEYSTFSSNHREMLLNKLKNKREQLTLKRKPKSAIKTMYNKQMEKAVKEQTESETTEKVADEKVAESMST
jgi:hypothetical protein